MRTDNIRQHPDTVTTRGESEIRFWLPHFDRYGNQQKKPWWDRKMLHQVAIDGEEYGFWEWESGVRDE